MLYLYDEYMSTLVHGCEGFHFNIYLQFAKKTEPHHGVWFPLLAT